jgi:hypothetical protein
MRFCLFCIVTLVLDDGGPELDAGEWAIGTPWPGDMADGPVSFTSGNAGLSRSGVTTASPVATANPLHATSLVDGRAIASTRVCGQSVLGYETRLALQPWINGFAFEREDTENALVHTAKRFLADKSLQGFNPESKLAQRQRPLC